MKILVLTFALTLWGCAGSVGEVSSSSPAPGTPACFEAHGCHEENPCQTWPNPDGGAQPVTCWVQAGPKVDTSGVVGIHPVSFWVCPDDYADQCALPRRECYLDLGCWDVPSCPQGSTSDTCHLEADSLGRLVDLWACPSDVNASACE